MTTTIRGHQAITGAGDRPDHRPVTATSDPDAAARLRTAA